MFLRLERKTRRTLFLFLGCFILFINGTAFFIITANNRQNFVDLGLSHARQQVRNVELHMQLLEETASRIAQDEVILRLLSENQPTDQITPRLGDYLASSVYISNLMILRPGGQEYRRLNVTTAPQLLALEGRGDSFWMVRPREGDWQSTAAGVLSYVTRIYGESGSFLGYFLLDSDLERVFSLCQPSGSGIFNGESACLLTRDGAILPQSAGDSFPAGEPPSRQTSGSYQLAGNTLFYYTSLQSSEDQLVQRLPLPVGRQTWFAGLLLFACTALCLLFCKLLVRLLCGTMIVPLRALQEKIDAFLQRGG